MIRLLTVAVLVAGGTAPSAVADPQDLVPGCTSGQVAQPGECTPEPAEVAPGAQVPLFGNFPGPNPNLPPSLTPANLPVVLPLGLTPRNVPVVLPLGLTPQNLPAA